VKPAAPFTAAMMPRLAPGSQAAPPSSLTREYATPLDRKTAPFHAVLRLSIPEFPQNLPGAVYGEHVGNRVIALAPSAIAESRDLGQSWRIHAAAFALPPRACFTTGQGTHLVCTHVPKDSAGDALIYRFDAEWNQLGAPFAVAAPWHGSASIGETDGTIMFAEYPDNAGKYRADPAPVRPARVWRSRDDGASWSCVKTVSPDEIRHLHTLVPDPAGCWWLSSGDRDSEVFVWKSEDGGDSWSDVTEQAPDVPLHPQYRRYARAVQRMTDLVFLDGYMIWGADDWLGYSPQNSDERPAAGSRMFRARMDERWKVEALGFCGKPVRNIVDVGPAYVVTTEAKHIDRGGRPDVFLMFKDSLDRMHLLAQIDVYGTRGTGFTYSLASRAAKDGVFFSHRAGNDAFRSDTRLLKWELILS
jgi:hypothetical protein